MSLDSLLQYDARRLVDCAMGRVPADLVFSKGSWVCVQSGEVVPDTDVAVIGERTAYVGPDASHTIGENTIVIDATGRYLVPGLVDAHMHIESGMLTVTEFVRAVGPHGTTTMFVDPHEIANIFGLDGVKLMVDEAALQPVNVFVQMPSCIPSAPGMETAGAVIGPEEVARAMEWPGIVGLGEMMNFPGVSAGDEKVLAEMEITRRAGKVIGGHYASPELDLPFHGYVAGGPEDDHEGTTLADAVARARQGMKVMMRFGSAWHDVATQVKAITELHLDPRHFILCTDDSHSQTLVGQGHMDRVVRHAIAQGLPPLIAIQLATINAAEHFGASRHVGMIAPGRFADILLVDDLVNLFPAMVFAHGRLIAENGRLGIDLPEVAYPDWVQHTVRLQRPLVGEDFRIAAPEGAETVIANVIGVIENQAPTRHLRLELPVRDGEIFANPAADLAKLALVERHKGTGMIQMGLVQGFGFRQACAVATTVAHDSHQMIVVGTDDENMAKAANALAECGGGQVVVWRGEIIGQVELPIAGLMSNENAEVVAQKAATVLSGFDACGCKLNNPNMQLSLLALVVIPSLRISDKGLVDVTRFQFVSLLEPIK